LTYSDLFSPNHCRAMSSVTEAALAGAIAARFFKKATFQK
jgi:hypothetical protein